MAYNIPELLQSRKAADGLLVLVMVLLGIASFGLGRLSTTEESKTSVALCPPAGYADVAQAAVATLPAMAVAENTGEYVASRNGSAFHFPWCSGAQRIKEENKIWFNTKADAQQAGYRPAANCKGL